MDKSDQYDLLQNLTSPVVAITSRSTNSETNGMIANSAIRASLVPECPRVAFYCFKAHYSHELITASGLFCLHLLHREQFDLIRTLGFRSGQNNDKLADLPHEISERGLPILSDAYGYFECEVSNAMDAGPSTFFMGDVVNTGRHPDHESLTLMDSSYFRENLPASWKDDYRDNKREVQEWASGRLEVDTEYCWTDPDSA
ncbi:MAG: flavin reductase family protein [bacterium]